MIRLLLNHDDVLPWAVMTGNQEAARTLLSNDVDTDNGGAYIVPLLLATRRADMSMANLFLEGGTDIDAQDAEGHSALHSAAQTGDEVAIQLLLQNGADTNIRDIYSKTLASCGTRSSYECGQVTRRARHGFQ